MRNALIPRKLFDFFVETENIDNSDPNNVIGPCRDHPNVWVAYRLNAQQFEFLLYPNKIEAKLTYSNGGAMIAVVASRNMFDKNQKADGSGYGLSAWLATNREQKIFIIPSENFSTFAGVIDAIMDLTTAPEPLE